jgi:hypothetical protein
MTFGPDLSLCPACGYFSLRVIESRKSKLARRRRHQCDKCAHRTTTHEVDDAFFQQAKENARIVEKMKGLLSSNEELPQVFSRCQDCSHNIMNSCSFGFPEFDTEEAFDCNHFKA